MGEFAPYLIGMLFWISIYIAFWVIVIRWVLKIDTRTRHGKKQVELLEQINSQLTALNQKMQRQKSNDEFLHDVDEFLEPLQ